MIIKSFNLNFENILKKNFILLYGENLSLISEIEEKITTTAKEKFGLSKKKYQEDYLIENPTIFDQLINSDNLFGEEEIIIITKASDKILSTFDQKIFEKNKKKIIFIANIYHR